jgi:predicted phage baseplate assembly protein
MLGFRPAPAQPARAVIRFEIPDPPPEGLPSVVARGTRSAAVSGPDGAPIVFETEADLPLTRRPLRYLLRRNGPHEVLEDITALNGAPGQFFFPFGPKAPEGAELWLGFPASADQRPSAVFPEIIHLHAWTAGGPLPSPGDTSLSNAERASSPGQGEVKPLSNEEEDLLRQLLVRPELDRKGSVAFFAAEPDPDRSRGSPVVDEQLELVEDGTGALRANGYLRVRQPQRAGSLEPPDLPDIEDCFWLVARVTSGFLWGMAPRLRRIAVNTVTAVARETIVDEQLEPSDGRPGQSRQLARKPVEIDSVELSVGGKRWQVLDDLLGSGGDAEVAALDPGTGELLFGDGEHGQIPHADAEIVMRRYRGGGGAHTNLSAEAVRILLGGLEGTNPDPAEGGADAETVEQVKRAAPARLRHLDRAVTLDDYAKLAREAGGMGRAKAMPSQSPDFPDGEVAGAVTVLVVPPIRRGQRHPPVATEADLQRVARQLESRRLAGTELFIRPASVVAVKVTAYVRPVSGLPWPTVQAQSREVLNDFLNAPERGFGGELRLQRLWAELLRAEAIDLVEQLCIDVGGVKATGDKIDVPSGVVRQLRTDVGDLEVIGVDARSAKATTDRIEIAPDAVAWGRPDHAILPATALAEDLRA